MVKLLYKLFLNAEIANATTITRITRSLNLNNMNMNMNNKYRSYSTLTEATANDSILIGSTEGSPNEIILSVRELDHAIEVVSEVLIDYLGVVDKYINYLNCVNNHEGEDMIRNKI